MVMEPSSVLLQEVTRVYKCLFSGFLLTAHACTQMCHENYKPKFQVKYSVHL